jgi:hypothetical protein
MEAYIILEENGKGIFCPKYRFPLEQFSKSNGTDI